MNYGTCGQGRRSASTGGGFRARRSRDGGNALVEFGLLLPFLLMLLLGIIDWGQVHFVRMTMVNAAREGARAGVTQAQPHGAEQEAARRAHEYLLNSGVTGAEVHAQMNLDLADGLTVTVSMPFTPLIGFVPTPRRLEARSVMRWELAP